MDCALNPLNSPKAMSFLGLPYLVYPSGLLNSSASLEVHSPEFGEIADTRYQEKG